MQILRAEGRLCALQESPWEEEGGRLSLAFPHPHTPSSLDWKVCRDILMSLFTPPSEPAHSLKDAGPYIILGSMPESLHQ